MDTDTYLQQASELYNDQEYRLLADHLHPIPGTPEAFDLRENLQAHSHLRKASYEDQASKFFKHNRYFAEFIANWLLYMRDSHFEDPDAAQANFDLTTTLYSSLMTVFAQEGGEWSIALLRDLSGVLVRTASDADYASGDTRLSNSSNAARLLNKTLSSANSHRTTEKRGAVFFLANYIFKIYFKLNNLRLCDTIITNIRSAQSALEECPAADRTTFAYYMGRMYLFQRRMRRAKLELRKAFDMCTDAQYSNRRLIFIYLTTASLPLGTFPKPELLEHFGLIEIYQPLIDALRNGNFAACLQNLEMYRDWHIKKGTYLLLKEKCEVICWRSLSRKTLYTVTNGQPLPPSGPPTLSLPTLLAAAQLAFKDVTLDLADIECMCASLLDQGYMKAYIHHSKQLLVLQKNEQVGFPPVSSVRMVGDDQ